MHVQNAVEVTYFVDTLQHPKILSCREYFARYANNLYGALRKGVCEINQSECKSRMITRAMYSVSLKQAKNMQLHLDP
jgi:hypothetical protein